LIDTYNHERFIEEAIQSVLSQDFPAAEREILVVDDGSRDRTPEILAKFGSQIRILHKTNGGQASAFNYGIPQCRGELIAFLDADDWLVPDKLTRVTNVMAANQEIGFVGHGIVTVFPDGTRRTER
jgi:glycosyltransferase involved in cell wall biosynthesis